MRSTGSENNWTERDTVSEQDMMACPGYRPRSSVYGAVTECLRDESETIKKTRLLNAPPSGTGVSHLGTLLFCFSICPCTEVFL